jgi:hypothetical protein
LGLCAGFAVELAVCAGGGRPRSATSIRISAVRYH